MLVPTDRFALPASFRVAREVSASIVEKLCVVRNALHGVDRNGLSSHPTNGCVSVWDRGGAGFLPSPLDPNVIDKAVIGDAPFFASKNHSGTPSSDWWTASLEFMANIQERKQSQQLVGRLHDGWLRKLRGNSQQDALAYGRAYKDALAVTKHGGKVNLPQRLCLEVRAIMGHKTCTIDFSNAFVQSPLPEDDPVWMHVPRGYKSPKGPDYCLKLKKSLYGHKVAPLLWFKYMTKHFKELGLEESKWDPCLWYGEDLTLICYVDDVGIESLHQKTIDNFVAKLRSRGLVLTQESSFGESLGIKFETRKNGSIVMTQKGLIQKILNAANMNDCNPNGLPASQTALGSDKDGQPMEDTWNYRAIVGMLLYLSTNTRPDLTLAVSQVARFSTNPKKSHATAVKTILRYLKGTMDKGTVVTPHDDYNLDMYVNADFAGLYGQEDDRDVNSVRSRTGYIINFSGWPILWKSVLQSHISQSTLEAEYSALSYALKTLLPLKWLLQEMVLKMDNTHLDEPCNVKITENT